MIQERIRQGVYVKDVAAELGVHPRTVSRALKRGGSPPGQRPAARKSKLDRYKPVIDRLLAAGVWNAAVILREIEEQGYRGQASILSGFASPLPASAERELLRSGQSDRRAIVYDEGKRVAECLMMDYHRQNKLPSATRFAHRS
jgi:Homeodomain-like domain-containing protein